MHIILSSGWTELFDIPMTYESVRLAQFYYINKFINLAEPFVNPNVRTCGRRSLFNVLIILLTLSMSIRHPGKGKKEENDHIANVSPNLLSLFFVKNGK